MGIAEKLATEPKADRHTAGAYDLKGIEAMTKSYNVFISWSGNRSKHAAEALREWLPLVLQAAKPWMSARDVDKGALGLPEVIRALNGIKVGISCLTPENLTAPWILYEAGALTKTLDNRTRLCTFLLQDLRPEDVNPPLGMFQATRAEKWETRSLLSSINNAISDDPVPEDRLDRLFEAMWPQLEHKLQNLPEPEEIVRAGRSQEDVLAEILEIGRSQANSRAKANALDAFLPIFEELLPLVPDFCKAARALRLQQSASGAGASSSGVGIASETSTGSTLTSQNEASGTAKAQETVRETTVS